mgnify:CR=1 FL=1
MIQMRWLKPNPNTVGGQILQYRVKQNMTVYAGMPTEEEKLKTANYQWSEWITVPIVVES